MKRCICRRAPSDPWNPPPPPEDCADCFVIPSLVLMSEDSVTPCSQTATIDLMEHAKVNVCSIDKDINGVPIICPISFQVLSFGKGLASVTVDNLGIVTFTTQYEIPTSEYSFIKVKATCSCVSRSTIVNIQVGFLNLCKNILCTEVGESCDPCDGTCKDSQLIIEMI